MEQRIPRVKQEEVLQRMDNTFNEATYYICMAYTNTDLPVEDTDMLLALASNALCDLDEFIQYLRGQLYS